MEHRGHILVVDDNRVNQELLSDSLGQVGYSVEIAGNGVLGLAALARTRFDAVLLDLLMPQMDGFEMLSLMKKDEALKHIPVIVISSLEDLESVVRCIGMGATDHLPRPFDPVLLHARIGASLAEKRRRDEELRFTAEVSEKNALLESQRDQLIRIQQQKEDLIAFLVHDLKNALSSVLGFSHVLLDNPMLDEGARQDCRRIASASMTMQMMVMNLLDLSRSEDGQLIPKWERTDLNLLIQEISDSMKSRLTLHKGTLILDEGRGDVIVWGDEDLLRRMIENLLDNGLKYAPESTALNVSARRVEASRVQIRVSDQGPGVPEEARERIFGKSVRLEKVRSAAKRAGGGLGLAFCKLVAETHGGRIWVEQNYPRGATFCVEIPTDARPGRDHSFVDRSSVDEMAR